MIVLDTHVWIWWVNQDGTRLPTEWDARLSSGEQVGVSAVSCFEVAWLVTKQRLQIAHGLDEWFDRALRVSRVGLLPLTPEIARLAAELPAHHGDPFDRIIIATAVANDATLLSADGKFPAYEILVGRLNP